MGGVVGHVTVTAVFEAQVLPVKECQSLPMTNQTPEKKAKNSSPSQTMLLTSRSWISSLQTQEKGVQFFKLPRL